MRLLLVCTQLSHLYFLAKRPRNSLRSPLGLGVCFGLTVLLFYGKARRPSGEGNETQDMPHGEGQP